MVGGKYVQKEKKRHTLGHTLGHTSPPTHLSAAPQIGSDVGVRSLCMEVD